MKILMGTLAGLVAGVAIGMLLAPVSGSEARNSIASGTRDQWRKLWGKVSVDDDPWAEYNERKAAVAENATA
jgi:gas vesicle protein